MTIEFDIWTWRDIQRVCGSVVAKTEGGLYPLMRYIRFESEDGICTAYGCDGYQLSRLTCRCNYQTPSDKKIFYLPPIRPLTGTKSVSISPDSGSEKNAADGPCHTVSFIDAKGRVTDTMCVSIPDEEYINVDLLIDKTIKNIDQYNNGSGQYCIAVNPKKLIASLEGMRDRDKVILNFASPLNGFTIRPGDGDDDILALVLPMKI